MSDIEIVELTKNQREMKVLTSARFAHLLSVVFNPFLMALAMIVMLAVASTPTALAAFRWASVMALISIGPILLIAAYLVRKGRLSSLLSALREQRTGVYLMAGVIIIVDYAIMKLINAPDMLLDGLEIGMPMFLIFMVINLFWKISVHAAMVAAAVTVSVVLYGWLALISALAVVLICWARVVLKEHTAAQVAAGAVLSAVVVVVGFTLTGLI